MFVNQGTLIEYENAEKRIAELEALLEKLGQGKLIKLKTVNGSNISKRLDGLERLANELLTQQERRCCHEGLLIARTWKRQVERIDYFLKVLADDGYPNELIADVVMAAGVVLIDSVYGRDVLCSTSWSNSR